MDFNNYLNTESLTLNNENCVETLVPAGGGGGGGGGGLQTAQIVCESVSRTPQFYQTINNIEDITGFFVATTMFMFVFTFIYKKIWQK